MGAITIHLPADLEREVHRASARAGVSLSALMAEAAKRRLADELPPPEVVALFGAFPDLRLATRGERWSPRE